MLKPKTKDELIDALKKKRFELLLIEEGNARTILEAIKRLRANELMTAIILK
jgi:hypothetical protein